MDIETYKRQYFEFYLYLEDDFFHLNRYVTIEKDNFSTFSIEYNRIYQSICSEIDVIAKELCGLVIGKNLLQKSSTLNHYCQIIQDNCVNFNIETVELKGFDIVMQPWKNWIYEQKSNGVRANNPVWWKAYNSVKHSRTGLSDGQMPNYKLANLENVLYALSALYILELYTLAFVIKCNPEYNGEFGYMGDIKSERLLLPRWYQCYSFFAGYDCFETKEFMKLSVV